MADLQGRSRRSAARSGTHVDGVLRFLHIALAAALAPLPAQRAAADLLTPVADDRYVFADHCPDFEPCQSDTRRPTASFAAFDDEASVVSMTASQQSSLAAGATQASMSGSLAAGSPSEPPSGITLGDAVFDITFEADAAASYSWTGAGSISGGGYGGAFLFDLTSDTVVFERSLPGSLAASGVLAAGHRYQIYHHATSLGQGSADWDFELSLPEPGFACSLASGLTLAVLLARRESSRARRR